MTFQVFLTDKFMMPHMGLSVTEDHAEFEDQLRETLQHGGRHFELPVSGGLSAYCICQIIKFAQRKRLGKHQFFITTSVMVPGDTRAIVKQLRDFRDRLDHPADLVYLENPVGLRGSDPMTLYETGPDGTHPRIRRVKDMFRRTGGGAGCLKVTPEYFIQDLRAVWMFMERAVLEAGLARALGLKNFSVEQIKAVLRGARWRPQAVQVEISAYNPGEPELLEMCESNLIALVASHPFGNPHHTPSKKVPALLDHATVVRIASKVGVGGEVVLVRALLQAGMRVVFTNTELPLPSFMLQNIFRFSLTQGQMNQLDRLHKVHSSQPLTKFDIRRLRDPMWPFLIYDDDDDNDEEQEHGEQSLERRQDVEEEEEDDDDNETGQWVESSWLESAPPEAEGEGQEELEKLQKSTGGRNSHRQKQRLAHPS